MQGLLPIERKIAEQRRDGGIIESFDQSFQGGSGGWFVVFDILVERGEKFAAREFPSGESVEDGDKLAELSGVRVPG
jgi:hypothetical protein